MLEITPTDMQRYRALVASIAVSDEAKDEVIRTVRSMMQDFVDRAFGDHPVQQCRGSHAFKASLESRQSAKLDFNQSLEMNPCGPGSEPSPANPTDKLHGENREAKGSHLLPRE